MKAIATDVIELPGRAVVQEDVGPMVTNVMNCYLTGNHRTIYALDLGSKACESMVSRGAGPLAAWAPTDQPAVDKFKSMIESMDARDRVQKIAMAMSELMKAFFAPPERIDDYGSHIASSILGATTSGNFGGLWEERWVAMPALGRVRAVPKLKAGAVRHGRSIADLRGRYTYYRTVCTQNSVAKGIGTTLMYMDRPRMDLRLIPGLDNNPGQQDINKIRLIEEQYDALQAFAMLYAVQWPLFLLRINEKMIREVANLALTVYPRSQPAIDGWMRHYEALAAVPLHPLLNVISNTLKTGRLDTYHGEREFLPLFGSLQPDERADSPDLDTVQGELLRKFARFSPEGVATENPHLTTGLLVEAVMATSDQATMLANNAAQWGTCITPDEPISVPQLAQQLLSVRRHTDHWTRIAGSLGWKELAGELGMIPQRTAGFGVCDGESYSAPPMAGLLGQLPMLSAGNVKINGRGRRTEPFWNTPKNPAAGADAAKIQYLPELTEAERNALPPTVDVSIMVVDGFQSDTNDVLMAERWFLVEGAQMGEEDIVVLDGAVVAADPQLGIYARAVIGDGRYVVKWYGPGENTKDGVFKQTAWDGCAEGPNRKDVTKAYQSGYAPYLNPTTSDGKPVIRLIRRNHFLHRFPVWMARADFVLYFTEMGTMRYALGWDGYVAFTGDIPMSYPTGPLESIVQILPAAVMAGGYAKLATASDQVKLDEEPKGGTL